MNPLSIIIWTCVVVFVLTALLTVLHISGLRKISNPKHANVLFTTLVIEIVIIAIGAFGNFLKNDSIIGTIKKINNHPYTSKSVHSVIQVHAGDLLAINESLGVAVVTFKHRENCKVSYKWRFKPKNGSPELNGNGELYEQYGIIDKRLAQSDGEQDEILVQNVGSKLTIYAGPYELLWSCSANSAWVYSTDKIRNLSVFKSKNINDFKL